MGLTIQSQESIRAIATGFSLPVSGAVSINLFDAASIGRNYAENGVAPKVVGTPIQSSQFGAKFNATNYIDTNLVLSALKPAAPEYTIIAVVSNVTDTTKNIPIAVSYKNSDSSGADVNGEGLALFLNTLAGFASVKNTDGTYANGNVQTGRSGFSTKSIIIPATRYKYKDRMTVSEYNSLVNISASRSAETAVTMPTKSIRIGRFGDALGGGIDNSNISYDAEFYGVFMFDRFLSDAEMVSMRTWILTKFLPGRGLSV